MGGFQIWPDCSYSLQYACFTTLQEIRDDKNYLRLIKIILLHVYDLSIQ